MGNCGSSVNCQQCYGNEEGCLKVLTVDTDIAGIGILVAFFLAALLTTGSIFVAYATDSLPESLLNDTDKLAIQRLQQTFIATRILPWLGHRWFGFKSLCFYCVDLEAPTRRPPIPRDQRVAAVTRFILAFSDQQLVTGFAILIASVVNHCYLTVYELEIVFCLAWFSATTHLATLKVLREYFYNNVVVRNWRLIGLSTFLVLLCTCRVFLIVAIDGDGKIDDLVNNATPLQCVVDGRTLPSNYSFLAVFLDVGTILFLLVFYASSIWDLFTDPRAPGYNKQKRDAILLQAGGRFKDLSPLDRGKLLVNSTIQQQFILRHVSKFKVHDGPGTMRRYRYSFLSYLPDIVFFMTYGIVNAVFWTWLSGIKTADAFRRMGFGQVCALVLLAIPALATSEIYNEAMAASTADEHLVIGSTTDASSAHNIPSPTTSQDAAVEPDHIKAIAGDTTVIPDDISVTSQDRQTTSQDRPAITQERPTTVGTTSKNTFPELNETKDLKSEEFARYIYRDIADNGFEDLGQQRMTFISLSLVHFLATQRVRLLINDPQKRRNPIQELFGSGFHATSQPQTFIIIAFGLRTLMQMTAGILFVLYSKTEAVIIFALIFSIWWILPNLMDRYSEIRITDRLIKSQRAVQEKTAPLTAAEIDLSAGLISRVLAPSALTRNEGSDNEDPGNKGPENGGLDNEGPSSSDPVQDEEEFNQSPPQRQDTEADVGIVPPPLRSGRMM